MKKFLVLAASLIAFSIQAQAEYTTVSCQSRSNPDRDLTLIIVNQDIKQVRVQSGGSLPRVFMANKLTNQSVEGLILYTVQSVPGLMEVESKILVGEGGSVRLNSDSFYCL